MLSSKLQACSSLSKPKETFERLERERPDVDFDREPASTTGGGSGSIIRGTRHELLQNLE